MLNPIRKWALGVPEPKRGRRIVVALTAFIDESWQGQILVYAGYFARLDDWEKRFTPEWQGCLDAEPRLEFFKMNQAMTRTKQWKGFSREQRDERVRDFYKIATSNILGGVSVVLPLDTFKEVVSVSRSVPQQQKNKHFFIVYNIMHDLLRGSDQLGFDEPIDFVFDDQTRGKSQIFAAWESFSKEAPVPKGRLGGSPRFEKDQDGILPLQAADMCAWIVRRDAVRLLTGLPEETYPWSNTPVTHQRILRVWTRPELEQYVLRGKIKSFKLKIGAVIP